MALFGIGDRPWYNILFDPVNVSNTEERELWRRNLDPTNVSGGVADIFTGGRRDGERDPRTAYFRNVDKLVGYDNNPPPIDRGDGSGGGNLTDTAQSELDWMKAIYERDYRFRDPQRYLQEQAWNEMSNTLMPDYGEMPGMADPYQMPQAPQFQQFDPGMAPGYNPYQVSQAPNLAQFQLGQGPTQDPFQFDLGQGLGMYDVRGVDPGGVYQRGEFDFQADPGYDWRMDQGIEAIERSAAARGGRESGRTQKDLMEFGQGLAAQEYGAAHQRYLAEEAAKQTAFESGAGRGLQAYGLEEPLRGQAFSEAAQRGLTRDITGAELGLGAYEGAAGRGLDQYLGAGQIGRQAQSDFQRNLLDRYATEQGLRQGEQQFAGSLGLESYLGEQGMRQAGLQDYQGNLSDIYRTQLPIGLSAYQTGLDERWKPYDATRLASQDYWNRLTAAGGYQDPSATGVQGAYGDVLQGLVGQSQMDQANLQNAINLLGIAANFGG